MRIKKVSSLLSSLSKVLNINSTSNQDTYSCEYINKELNSTVDNIETQIQTLEDTTKTTKTTSIAEDLTVTDASPVGAELNIRNGKTWQATRSGKNRIAYYDKASVTVAGVTVTVKDNIITLNGECTEADNTLILGLSSNGILKNTEIAIGNSLSAFYVSGTMSGYCRYRLFNDNWSDALIVDLSLLTQSNKYTHTINDSSFTADITKCDLRLNNGVVFNNFSFRLMLTDVEDNEYEDFGVSPSPDYPSPIRNIGDNINILDYGPNISGTQNGVTYNYDKITKIWTLNGTATKQTDIHLNDMQPVLKANTPYVLTNYVLEGTITNGDGGTLFLQDKLNGYKGIASLLKNNTSSSIKNSNLVNIDLTMNDNLIRLYTGTTFTNYKFRTKLERGSTPTSYSPYGCGCIDFRKENKNFLNHTLTTRTIDTLNLIVDEDRTISFSGTRTTKSQIDLFNEPQTYPAGNYILSGVPEVGSPSTYRLNVYNNGQLIAAIYHKGPVTIPENNKITMQIAINANVNTDGLIFKPMLRLASIEDDTYVPHQEQNVTFPLQKGQVLHQQDYLTDNTIHQKIKTIILDGTESWGLANNVFYKSVTDSAVGEKIRIKCTHFKGATNQPSTSNVNKYNPDNSICCASSSTARLYIKCTSITSVDEWKSYLAEQYANGTPIILEYPLAEEIVIPYTQEQKQAQYELQHLQMYEGYTYISCTDEIKPDIQLTYLYNNQLNKTYGTRLDADERKINELKNNINNVETDLKNKVDKTNLSINISSPVWTYNTTVKFFTLPYSSGVHSYIITGVVSYIATALYSNVMLLVTQTDTNIRIDKLVGNDNNVYTNTGIDLYVKNMQAQSTLHLYGVCYILR